MSDATGGGRTMRAVAMAPAADLAVANAAIDRLTGIAAAGPSWDGAYRRLLVAFDGSRASTHAAMWAGEIARLSGGRITLLTVTPTRGAPARRRGEPDAATTRIEVERIARELKGAGIEVGTVYASGDPPLEILRAARLSHADLLLMGASRMPSRRHSIGSVAAHVTERAAVTILLAKRAPRERRMLLATDGETPSRAALPPFLAFSSAWGAPSDVIHVRQAAGSAGAARDVGGLRDAQDAVRLLAAEGPVCETISRAAIERHADLILLGTRPLSGAAPFPPDSVGRMLADRAATSVLLVRRTET